MQLKTFAQVSACTLLATSVPALADSATDWWEIANRYNLAQQGSATPSSPDVQRASARAALAVFEAVNAIDPAYKSHLDFPPGDKTASQDAAAATAAYRVLLQHYPQNSAALDESYMLAMAQVADGAAKAAGVAIGERAAKAAMAAGGIDPAVVQEPYRPRTTPGEWIGASLPSLEMYWAAFKPWAASDLSHLISPPPPSLGSAVWARDYDEVRRLGSRASKERTPVQTAIAKNRQGFDLSPMLRYIADRPGRRQVDNARLIAVYHMAMDDAVQAMVVSKQKYNFWRPITAIRNGALDGNDATQVDPSWVPLLPTPNFAEYPCGHCTAVSVQAEVLKLAGGLPADTRVRIGGMNANVVLQSVASWDEAVRQVSDGRMLGGVHFRFSNEAGEEIGRKAARRAVDTLLQPVQKPKNR